jgi:single-strand DNA-binding protein
MYSLNKAQLIGNLTRDPEVKETPNGKKVAQIGIATNSEWKDKEGNKQEKVEFHNVVLWSGMADVAEKYLKKGSKVFIEGRLETRTWEDNGVKKYKTEIVAEDMIMLSGKDSEMSEAPKKPAAAEDAPW